MMLLQLEEKFLSHLLRVKNASPATVKTYRSAYKRARETTERLGYDWETEGLDDTWITALVEEWSEAGLAPRTIHRDITALRSMFRYARRRRITRNDPFADVELPAKGAVERVHLSNDQLNALVDATRMVRNSQRAVMTRALMLTEINTAMRVGELVALRVSDVDLCGGVVHVNHGKGDKSREIVISERTVEALREWLAVREAWLATREGNPRLRGTVPDALWLADRGRGLSTEGIYGVIDELCFFAGFDVKIRVHDIRHASAKRIYREGVPLEVIQQILGHTSRVVTEKYLIGASPDTKKWRECMALPENTVERAASSAGVGTVQAPAETPDAPAAAAPAAPRLLRRSPALEEMRRRLAARLGAPTGWLPRVNSPSPPWPTIRSLPGRG